MGFQKLGPWVLSVAACPKCELLSILLEEFTVALSSKIGKCLVLDPLYQKFIFDM